MTVAITRMDLDASDLRRVAAREKNATASRRMLALALVLEGHTRTVAAQVAGMDRQSLRDWVHRYNAVGLEGLKNRTGACGARRKLTEAQEATFAGWVREGPTQDVHKVVRWRCKDLRDEIARRFGVEMHERTVGKLLARLNFSRVSVRPRHPEQDIAAQEAHKINFAGLVAAVLPEHARRKPIELWWQDEARIGQQGSLTYVWADKGSRPRAPHDQRYASAYLFGAVCPARGVGAALVLPSANIEAMNLHLAEISAQIAPGAHAVLTLDGAGWHRPGGKLKLPNNISLLPLPPYSPELNPVENIWQYMRQNHLANRVFDTYSDIIDACCDAWNALVAQPDKITSIATRHWAKEVTQ